MLSNFIKKNISIFLIINLIFVIYQILSIYSDLTKTTSITLTIPSTSYLVIFMALCIQIVLYAILSSIQSLWLYSVIYYKKGINYQQYIYHWQLFIIIVSIIFLFTSNGYFFTNNIFNNLFYTHKYHKLMMTLLILSTGIIVLLTINTIKILWSYQITLVIIVITTAYYIYIIFNNLQTPAIIPAAQPNIILIGIDSVNPERITLHNTPTIYNFLHSGAYFINTISPLARTYPAWTTILTGLYPINHYARENLIPISLVKSNASIIWQIKQLQYQTMFATDERRFSNIDKDFGFDRIIGPRLGINDFILGSFYNFPLSNLLINSPIGAWLFPYQYINRASHYVYYPQIFDKEITKTLQKNHQQPCFLAVHFTLAHWPYTWASSKPYTKDKIQYFQALHRVDKQVATLLKQLQKYKLLNNSLIILLSDHGEALYFDTNSRLTQLKNYQGKLPSTLVHYFKTMTATTLSQSNGHGSDILSPIQFSCLLGIKIFFNNKQINQQQIIKTRIALIDIAPTIYDFLHLSVANNFDGISLLQKILNPESKLIQRAFILESGMLPNLLIATNNKVFLHQSVGINELMNNLYKINKKTQYIELKKDKLLQVNASKLYGIIDGHWLLALYPNQLQYIPVLMNLHNKKWTDSANSVFAKTNHLQKLLKKLQMMYNNDLHSYPYIKQYQ